MPFLWRFKGISGSLINQRCAEAAKDGTTFEKHAKVQPLGFALHTIEAGKK